MTMSPTGFRAWRLRLGMSQTAAGLALGVTLRTIRNYETGLEIKRHVEFACLYLSEHEDILLLYGVPRRQIIPNTVTLVIENDDLVDIDIPERK